MMSFVSHLWQSNSLILVGLGCTWRLGATDVAVFGAALYAITIAIPPRILFRAEGRARIGGKADKLLLAGSAEKQVLTPMSVCEHSQEDTGATPKTRCTIFI